MLINYCPLCGVGPFAYPYANANELRNSCDICECCGCEYGCDDTEQYYQKWVAGGCVWFNPKNKPSGWAIENQLKFQIRPWPPS